MFDLSPHQHPFCPTYITHHAEYIEKMKRYHVTLSSPCPSKDPLPPRPSTAQQITACQVSRSRPIAECMFLGVTMCGLWWSRGGVGVCGWLPSPAPSGLLRSQICSLQHGRRPGQLCHCISHPQHPARVRRVAVTERGFSLRIGV